MVNILTYYASKFPVYLSFASVITKHVLNYNNKIKIVMSNSPML